MSLTDLSITRRLRRDAVRVLTLPARTSEPPRARRAATPPPAGIHRTDLAALAGEALPFPIPHMYSS